MDRSFQKIASYKRLIGMFEELKKSDPDAAVFEDFMGFGGLKELLLPLDDKTSWTNSDLQAEPYVQKVHESLREIFADRYKEAYNSLKGSILSSFYTPDFITEPIITALKAVLGQDILRILEPSAGTGKFVKAIKNAFPEADITAIEKDHLTSRFLRAANKEIEVINSGFEDFRNRAFDLVISNIPFGSFGVYDDGMFREGVPAKIKAATRIHTYFFVKSLDNLKDGRMAVLITSNGVMDAPGNKEVREFLMKNADLVTAIRLPNTTFQSAGTYPMTDIVILRKNTNKKKLLSQSEKAFIVSERIDVKGDDGQFYSVDISGYYKFKPDNALGEFIAGGQYRKDSLDMNPIAGKSTKDISASIHDIVSTSLKGIAEINIVVPEQEKKTIENNIIPPNHPSYDLLKRGNLIAIRGNIGRVEFGDAGSKLFFPETVIKNTDQALLFIEIRNTYNKLIDSELAGDVDAMVKLRARLNDLYDVFTFRYGNFHLPVNKKLFLFDSEGIKILSLEKFDGKQYQKADIFNKQINNVEQRFSRPESLKDAVLVSLNAKNGIDIDFICEITQKDKPNVLGEAFSQDLFFRDLAVTDREAYLTKDQFLSGNVVKRLEEWENYHNHNIYNIPSDVVEKNIEALKAVRPVFLKREMIDLNLGERWIPVDIYEQFASDLLKTSVTVKYLEAADQYLLKLDEQTNENTITYAASTAEKKIKGSKIIEYALADTQPFLRKRIDENTTVPDVDGMKNVEMKIKEVKDAFENFLNSRPDISERIELLYNRKVNHSVKRQFDGSHLQLSGLKHYTPRDTQKNCTWMLLQQDTGNGDHVVGAGKTLIMCMTAWEMRRLGIAKKPLIIGLKANVGDIAATFKQSYPQAKILFPTEKDFSPKKRQALFSSIAANDWDAVILSHEQFQAIEQSPRIKKDILQAELDTLEENLLTLREDKELSKRILKGLEKSKQNLEAQIKEQDGRIKRDDGSLDFEQMGFDHLFVDESHEFKNLRYTTRHNNVAGLGPKEGSQKALNLLYACRTIQAKKGGDKGISFFSGTPISNSLVELYLIFKYLRPNALRELGINSFDAWAKMYARKTATYEFTVTNEVKLKERYREFIKVPELARFYAEITDYVGDHNLKIDKPSLQHVVVNVEPTESQKEYTERLIQFTKTKNGSYIGKSLSKAEESAYMLIATNLATKMSLDMRLIDPDRYGFEKGSKLDILCQNVFQEYKDSNSYKGTQLIFCDSGTPKGEDQFSLYHEIKRILTGEYGIKGSHIQFIHDFDKKTEKDELFSAVRNGEVRILLGSTKKLGIGVNVQDRIIAMHNLDTPWNPKDFEQRGGRGARFGNWAAKEYRGNVVKNYVYAVNRTLDAYRFNLVSIKQNFISQIKKNNINQRKFDEGGFDDGAMPFAEYVAILSGNQDLLEKVKLEKKLADIERGYSVFMKRKYEAESWIKWNQGKIRNELGFLDKFQTDWSKLEPLDLEKELIVINGKSYQDKKEVGEILLREFKKHQTAPPVKTFDEAKRRAEKEVEIASLGDFKLMLIPGSYHDLNANDKDGAWINNPNVYVLGPSGWEYNYAEGKLNENPALAGRYIIDCLKRIPKQIEDRISDIKELEETNATYQKVIQAEFKDADQIKDLKKQIDDLGARIEKQMNQDTSSTQNVEPDRSNGSESIEIKDALVEPEKPSIKIATQKSPELSNDEKEKMRKEFLSKMKPKMRF